MVKQTRTELKKIRTQKLIIDVTIELVEKQGYDETTMEQIANTVDIAKGTLYNHYSCKEEIISDYIKKTFVKENKSRIEKIEKINSTSKRLFYLFDQLLNGVKRRKIIFEKYLIYKMRELVSFDRDKKNESGMKTPINVIIRLGQESGEIRSDLPTEMLSELIQFAFIELVKSYYSDSENFNSNLSIEQSISIFLRGAGNLN